MKKILLSLLAVGLLAFTGYSQTNALPSPSLAIGIDTNANPPVLTGPFIDIIGSLASATNIVVAVAAEYSPDTSTFGASAALVYNITPVVGTMLRFDYLPGTVAGSSDFSMVSANLQLQVPMTIAGKIQWTWFGLSGIATPLGGAGTDNGTVQGVFGAGADIKIPSFSSHWSMAFDVEKWTALPGLQYRFSPLVWKF